MVKNLLGIRLRAAFSGLLRSKKSNGKPPVGRIILVAFLFLYLAVVFVGLAFSMAFSLAVMLLPRTPGLYFGIFMVAAFSIVFIFSIFETKSELFDCKDNELLISMPIKPRAIVLSRIFTVLIFNYVEEAVIMLPAILVYSVMGGSITGVIGALLVSLLLAPLATALASAVGYLVALISRRTKKNSFVTVAISLVFLFAYFIACGQLGVGMEFFFENTEEGAEIIIENLGFLGVIGNAALLKPLNFALFVLASLGVCALAYYLISKSFFAIATDNRGAKRTKYKERRLERSSALVALLKNEFARFFSSATYMLNAGIGIAMQLIISVIIVFQRPMIKELGAIFEAELGLANITAFFAPMVAGVMALFACMTTMSSSALSLEGQHFWLIKSMPVKGRDVLMAKTLPQIILTLPVSVISSILTSIAFSLPITETLLVISFVVLTSVTFAVYGTVINVALPKFEFENEAQVIKQSLSVTVVMLTQLAFGIILIIASIMMPIILGSILSLLLLNLLMLVIGAVILTVFLRVSRRKYEAL